MSKARVFTPVVAVADNMQNARKLNIDGLIAGKLRIGLLDNTKPNAGRLLGYVGQLLTERGLAAGTVTALKKNTLLYERVD